MPKPSSNLIRQSIHCSCKRAMGLMSNLDTIQLLHQIILWAIVVISLLLYCLYFYLVLSVLYLSYNRILRRYPSFAYTVPQLFSWHSITRLNNWYKCALCSSGIFLPFNFLLNILVNRFTTKYLKYFHASIGMSSMAHCFFIFIFCITDQTSSLLICFTFCVTFSTSSSHIYLSFFYPPIP